MEAFPIREPNRFSVTTIGLPATGEVRAVKKSNPHRYCRVFSISFANEVASFDPELCCRFFIKTYPSPFTYANRKGNTS
jgi:hypothetical protein